MNERQRIVLWISFGLIAVSSLFAPWRSYTIGKHNAPDSTVYRAIFLGPPDQIIETHEGVQIGETYIPGYTIVGSFKLDTPQLLLEWIFILILAGLAILALNKKQTSFVDEKQADIVPNEDSLFIPQSRRRHLIWIVAAYLVASLVFLSVSSDLGKAYFQLLCATIILFIALFVLLSHDTKT